MFRGYLVRLKLRSLKMSKCAVLIQSWWRCIAAQRYRDVLLKRREVAEKLKNMIAARVASRKIRTRVALRAKYRNIAIIQRMVRAFLACRQLYDLRRKNRLCVERTLASSLSVMRSLAEYQLAILRDSLRRPIGKLFTGVLGEECIHTGPTQALFVHAVGPKARTDRAALVTNRIDTKRLMQLFSRIHGLRTDSKQEFLTYVKSPARRYDLASAFEQGLFRFPSQTCRLSTTDLDIIVAKCRSATAVGSGISYADFVRVLEEVGRLHLRGSKEGHVEKLPDKGHADRIELHSVSAPGFEDLAMVLKVIFSCHHDAWFEKVACYLVKESSARLGVYVSRVQRLVRRRIARAMLVRLRALLESERRRQFYNRRVVVAQSIVRRFIHRRRAIHIAQELLTEYIPCDGGPRYWHNPRTRLSKTTKPKVLGQFSCRAVPLSIPGFEVLIRCSNCEKTAELNCASCRESYCSRCFSSLHCKGSRRDHTSTQIPYCAYCRLQHATKSCIACTVIPPDPRSSVSLIKGDRRLYCDICFHHHHDSRSVDEIRAEYHLLTVTRELALARQQLCRRPLTKHSYDTLVQSCEECLWRAATQRCIDCDQIYCPPCLSTLHSRGPFSRHRAELLPYYSPELHALYLKDAAMREERQRVNEVIRLYAEMFESWHKAAVLKVQTWWRTIFHGRIGRSKMRERRLEQRRAFRLRRSDNKHFRNTLWYRLRDVFGTNPPLKSDTVEERVLQRIPAFMRERAREYILKNKEDWGFFRVSRTLPQKGIPKVGFDVGSVEELIDQAKRGGYRLPGRVMLLPGSREASSTVDLDQFPITNRFVRIDGSVYLVSEAREKVIVLDRNVNSAVSVAGSVMYLLPSRLLNDSFMGSIDRRAVYFMLRYLVYDSVYEYAVSQALVVGYTSILYGIIKAVRRLVRLLHNVVYHLINLQERLFHGLDEPQEAARWARLAEALEQRRSSLSKYIKENSPKETQDNGAAGHNHGKGSERAAQLEDNSRPPWIANHDELEARHRREAELSREELLADADNWVEDHNPMNRQTCWVHRETRELTFDIPSGVRLKREEEEADTKRRALDLRKKQMSKLATSFRGTRR